MELSKKSISIAFVIILAITILVSLLGMLLMSHQPLVLQGQIETTEIRIKKGDEGLRLNLMFDFR